MRSFIISIFCTAVFFVGISALIEDVSAKFRADEKAMELIKKSRAAIGGEKNIAAVKSMTIVGEIEHYKDNDVKNIQTGGMEINFAFPNRFAKMMRIGAPGKQNRKESKKRIERLIISEDEEFGPTDKKGNKKRVVIRKGGDKEEVRKIGEDVELKDGKIIIRKDDGTVEEFKTDEDNLFVIKEGDSDNKTWESKDGEKVVIRKKGGGDEKFGWESKDDNKMIFDDDELLEVRVAGAGKNHGNEFLQTALALLMTAPKKLDVTYKFVGTGDVDGKASNIIEVGSKGSKFKLYLDSSSNLPQMISYYSTHVSFGSEHKDAMKTLVVEKIENFKDKTVNIEKKYSKPMLHELRFSDFRQVDGLFMPHTWSQAVEGKPNQTIRISRFQVNPSNIDEKFKERHFKREMMFKSKEKKKS